MEVYFDNGATTKVYPEVRDLMVRVMDEDYGNPSSLHMKGVEAEKHIKTATTQIAKALKVDDKEVFFTSGGTEANNMAIIGAALANRRSGKHIISTDIEHDSVTSTLEFLKKEGFEITYISVDSLGYINLEQLEKAIRPDTILVTTMFINNEVGTIQQVDIISKIIKKTNIKTLYHIDAIQAFGKVPVLPRIIGVDMVSISAHKIHGPKGCGALYIKNNTHIVPIIYGGGQQRGFRSGTENVPAIAGFGIACELTINKLQENIIKMKLIKKTFLDKVEEFENVSNNSGNAPHVASVSFMGVGSEVMLHALEERGIFVSAGSACSSNKKVGSKTLRAMGLEKEKLESTLRFSFHENNTLEEIEYTIKVIRELLPMLRKYTRKK